MEKEQRIFKTATRGVELSSDLHINFEDLILLDLSETELQILDLIERGIDTVEDIAVALNLSIYTIEDLLAQLRQLGVTPVFHNVLRENILDRLIFAKILPPERNYPSKNTSASEIGVEVSILESHVRTAKRHNKFLYRDYIDNILPELLINYNKSEYET